MQLQGFRLMLCMLLLPHLSFLTLVMAPFALKRCCTVFRVRLDIVVVVVVVVCKLWQSALSQCAIFVWTRCTSYGNKGKGKNKINAYMTWIKIPFNIARKMFWKHFHCSDRTARPQKYQVIFLNLIFIFSVVFFQRPLLTCLLTLLVVSYQLSKRGHFVS